MIERLLITGASGFIGGAVLNQDLARYEVHAVSRRAPDDGDHDVTWHTSDLLSDDIGALVGQIRPTHLLHLAWVATPGVYPQSPENLRWLEASVRLLEAFGEAGGKRVVLTGTCLEYDLSTRPSREDETPLRPTSLYATSKEFLSRAAAAAASERGFETVWARVFYLYGPREKPGRLVSSLVTSMLQGRKAVVAAGSLKRDYMYVDDVAAALVHLTGTEITGPVNVASGEATSLEQIGIEVARACGTEDLLRVEDKIPADTDGVLEIVADTTKLRGTGWRPAIDLATGIHHTVEWWQEKGQTE